MHPTAADSRDLTAADSRDLTAAHSRDLTAVAHILQNLDMARLLGMGTQLLVDILAHLADSQHVSDSLRFGYYQIAEHREQIHGKVDTVLVLADLEPMPEKRRG